jgi:hypothetical protein
MIKNSRAHVTACPGQAPPPPVILEGDPAFCRHVAVTHAGCQPAVRLRLTVRAGLAEVASLCGVPSSAPGALRQRVQPRAAYALD